MVSDIKSESCYLTWDAPEDNGGSEITNYIIERRDASKKKSDFEQITVNVIDRRYGVSEMFSLSYCFFLFHFKANLDRKSVV